MRARAPAAGGAAALTFAIGYLVMRGLALTPDPTPAAGLRLIPVDLPQPAQPRPTPKPFRSQRKRGAPSAPNLHAEPTEIVAPRPEVPVPLPPPLPAAPIAGVGAAASAGNADVPGPGTGAGGQGNGRGAGGTGNGEGGSPPRQIKGRIRNSDYPKGAGEAGIGGTVSVRFSVETDGRATDCNVTESSGSAELDEVTCRLIEQRFRFRPSRDESGKPVRSTIVENHTWVIDRIADAAEPPRR